MNRCIFFARVLISSLFILLVSSFSGCKSLTPERRFNLPSSSEIQNDNSRGESYAHYISSMIYYRQGNLNKAIEELEKTIQTAGNKEIPNALLIRLVRLYIIAERYNDALTYVNEMLSREQLPPLYLIQGELYHRLGKIDEAISAFQKAIELNPENVLGYTALLDIQEKTNDLVSAIEIYQKMIQRKPDSALLHYQLGLTYARIKNNQLAIQSLEKALQIDPRMIRAHYILALLYLDEKLLNSARENLEKYVSKKQDDPKAWEVLMGTYTRLGEFDRARESARKLAQFPELSPLQKLLLSFFYARIGDLKTSASFLPVSEYPLISKILSIVILNLKGDSKYKEDISSLDSMVGNLDSECNDFITAIWNSFGEGVVSCWFYGKLAEIDLEVPSITIGLVRSRLLLIADQHQEAVDILSGLFSNYERNLWVNYYLAICYEKLKKYDEAERHLKICLELDPENAEILNFLGYLYADLNIKIDEAESLIKRALKLDPENPYYLDSLGWVYYRKGNADEAITYIKRAIYKMDTDDAVLRDHLGDAYLLKGDVNKAIAEWKRALFLDSKNEQIRKKIEKYEAQR